MAAVAAAVVRVVVPLLVVAAVERARDEVARPESEPMVEIEALLKPRPKVGKALLSSWFPLRLVPRSVSKIGCRFLQTMGS